MTTAPVPSAAARPLGGSLWLTLLAATVAAAIANAVIYLLGKAAGASFTYVDGGTVTDIPLLAVIIASVVWLLLGTLVAGLAVPRLSWARPALQILAAVLAVLSCISPLVIEADTLTKVLLSVFHLVLGVFYIGALSYAGREA